VGCELFVRGVWDGAPVIGLQVQCSLASAPSSSLLLQTDGRGAIHLPLGEWRIDAPPPYTCPKDPIHVSAEHQIVWISRTVPIAITVVDPAQRAIVGARVSAWAAGEELASRVTNERGSAEVRLDVSAMASLIRVYEPHHLPRTIPLDPVFTTAGESTIRVTLEPCTDVWTLRIVDPLDAPIAGANVSLRPKHGLAPTIPLGTSDVDGRLEVWGTWMLRDHFFELAGTAYPIRTEAPAATPGGSDAATRRLRVPRRVDGNLQLVGWTPADPTWQFLDHETDASGTGILLPANFSAPREGLVAATLPANWRVRILGRSRGRLVVDEVHEVTAAGWTLPVTPRQPVVRSLVIESTTARIAGVRSFGEAAAVLFPDARDAQPASSVRTEVAADTFLTLAVSFVDGNEVILNGEPGTEDAVITLSPPGPVDVTLQFLDRSDSPLCDVRTYLSRRTDTRFVACSAPGWRWMLGRNGLRLPLDAQGKAKAALPPGTYEVRLAQLRTRDAMGQNWRTDEGGTITVAAGMPGTFQLHTARPRLATIALVTGPGAAPPERWTVVLGDYSRSCQGRQVSTWLTEDEQDLEIRDGAGQEIATVRVPAGTTPIRLDAIVRR
jgi:hypothetical protein